MGWVIDNNYIRRNNSDQLANFHLLIFFCHVILVVSILYCGCKNTCQSKNKIHAFKG